MLQESMLERATGSRVEHAFSGSDATHLILVVGEAAEQFLFLSFGGGHSRSEPREHGFGWSWAGIR